MLSQYSGSSRLTCNLLAQSCVAVPWARRHFRSRQNPAYATVPIAIQDYAAVYPNNTLTAFVEYRPAWIYTPSLRYSSRPRQALACTMTRPTMFLSQTLAPYRGHATSLSVSYGLLTQRPQPRKPMGRDQPPHNESVALLRCARMRPLS